MNIAAVIVTYQSETEEFEQLLLAVLPQVSRVIVVDNGSEHSPFDSSQYSSVELISLMSNFGIAYAQNKGIALAKELEMTHVLLLDQDSLPALDMVQNLAFSLQKLMLDRKVMPAGVGALRIDTRTGTRALFMTEKRRLPKRFKANDVLEHSESVYSVMYLISSGTLIPISVFEQVGLMKEDYFIDRVDTEWCFRARSKGYQLFGVPSAKLYHSLGDSARAKVFLKRTSIPWHQPFRHYYVFRNTILMLKQTKMPLIWKLHAVWRLIQVGSLNLLFSQQRAKRLKFIWFGIIHGLSNVTGKLNPSGFFCEPIDSVKW